METGNMHEPNQNSEDENSYIPGTIFKQQQKYWRKKPSIKKHSTRLQEHIVWRNPLLHSLDMKLEYTDKNRFLRNVTLQIRNTPSFMLIRKSTNTTIPQPFLFLSIQSPTPRFPHFNFRPHLFPPIHFLLYLNTHGLNQVLKPSLILISDVETPNEILDSEPSPTNFSQPPFQPITPLIPVEPSLSPSSHTDATPIFPLF